MPNWPDCRLGEVTDLLAGFAFKSNRYCAETEGVRLLRGDNVVQGNLRWAGAKYWPATQVSDFEDYTLERGDVVLAMDRPWIEAGLKTAVMREADLPALLVQRVARLRAIEGLDQGFLRWVVFSPEFTEYVKRVQTGTAVPHISGGQIRDFNLSLPPLDVQRRIAGVLGAIDDLIDTNRAVAAGAEELAVALTEAASDLISLGELANVASLRQVTPDGIVDHFALPAFDARRLPETVIGATIKSKKQLIADPVVLVSRLNPHIPRTWMVYPDRARPSLASPEFVPLSGAPTIEAEEVWAVCSTERFFAGMASRVTGTTGSHQRVDKSAVCSVHVPDVRTLTRRQRVAIRTLVKEAAASRAQAHRLAQARDALLPLLMSGRVSPGEAAVA